MELIGEEDLDNVVKYRYVNKEKKWNECQVWNQFLSSIFSGAWTPTVCEFTRKMSKFQQNEHTPEKNLTVTWVGDRVFSLSGGEDQ